MSSSLWLVRRLLTAVALSLAAAVVLVILAHLLPGDPLTALIRERGIDPATATALRTQWGFDRPLPIVVQDFIAGLFRGELGTSLAEQRPVVDILLERLWPTLLLGGLTLIIDFTVGLILGSWLALRPASWPARIVNGLTTATYAVPSFVLALLLVWVFSIKFGWLPPAGFADPVLSLSASGGERLLDHVRHLALPLLTMVLATIAVPIRHQRAAALETVDAPWVTAARARGIPPILVAWRHVWRPALTPIVTLLGLWLPLMVSGAVFVEFIFGWPGLGALLADAAANRDLPVVIGAGILIVMAVQLGSLLADIGYRLVDPLQRSR